MNIYGKFDTYNKLKKFKDLKFGDIFYFIDKSLKDDSDLKIYMRGGHTTTDHTAINLETGIMYSFDEHLPVKILSADLHIEKIRGNIDE